MEVFFVLHPLLLISLRFLLDMLLGLVPFFFSPLFFASCVMSSFAMKDGSPVQGRFLVARKVRGIGKSRSEKDLSV